MALAAFAALTVFAVTDAFLPGAVFTPVGRSPAYRTALSVRPMAPRPAALGLSMTTTSKPEVEGVNVKKDAVNLNMGVAAMLSQMEDLRFKDVRDSYSKGEISKVCGPCSLSEQGTMQTIVLATN